MRVWVQLLALFGLLSGAALGEEYRIDPRHSRPVFAVEHLGFSTQYGRFNELRGTIELDREGRRGRIDVSIDAASVDLGDEDWNTLMRGADFFATDDNPYLIYRAEHIEFQGEVPVAADGRLALLGVVRPLRLRIERFRCGLDVSTRRTKCGADASATLRRSEFGMTKYIPFVADEVRLHLPVEAFRLDADEPAPR